MSSRFNLQKLLLIVSIRPGTWNITNISLRSDSIQNRTLITSESLQIITLVWWFLIRPDTPTMLTLLKLLLLHSSHFPRVCCILLHPLLNIQKILLGTRQVWQLSRVWRGVERWRKLLIRNKTIGTKTTMQEIDRERPRSSV